MAAASPRYLAPASRLRPCQGAGRGDGGGAAPGTAVILCCSFGAGGMPSMSPMLPLGSGDAGDWSFTPALPGFSPMVAGALRIGASAVGHCGPLERDRRPLGDRRPPVENRCSSQTPLLGNVSLILDIPAVCQRDRTAQTFPPVPFSLTARVAMLLIVSNVVKRKYKKQRG